MKVDPSLLQPMDCYKLLLGCVMPRPIAWVSTISADDVLNLAPFSFFNVASRRPPMLVISIGPREAHRVGVGHPEHYKDTLANLRSTGEFVVNVVTESLVEQAVITAANWPAEIDEFAMAALTPAASVRVRPPHIV